MNFLKKNKKSLIAFLFSISTLGIIIAIVTILTGKDWTTIASFVLSIGSLFIVFVIFLIQMDKSEEQNKVLKEQSDVLISAKVIIEEAKKEIEHNQEGINKVQENQSTQVYDDFPDNIPYITEKLKEWAKFSTKDKKKREIIISTDVIGYGVLSNNKAFRDYYYELRHIASENTIDIQWFYYNVKLQEEQSRDQFAAFIPLPKDNEEMKNKKIYKFSEYIKRCNDNLDPDCKDCEYKQGEGICEKKNKNRHCYLIKTIKKEDPFKLSFILNSLEELTKSDLNTIPQIEQFVLYEKLPFFSWILVEHSEKEKKATEVIISYPSYKEGSNEKCFFTSQPNLTDMFYGIVKDFIDEKSTPIQKQENKENEHMLLNKNIDDKYPIKITY